MIRRVFGIYSVFALSLMLWATPGIASTQATQATDPNAGSPAGVVYSIPLDTARQDAAPHRRTRAAAGGSGGSAGGAGGSAGGAGATGATGATGGSTGGTGGGTASPGAGGGSSTGAGGSGASGRIATASSSARSAPTHLTGPPVLVVGGQPGSLIHSANGFGSSSSVPGLNGRTSAGLAAVQGNAGSAPLLASLLSLVVLAVGGFIGARAWRAPRHGRAADVG